MAKHPNQTDPDHDGDAPMHTHNAGLPQHDHSMAFHAKGDQHNFVKHHADGPLKKSGKFHGKSNALGHGGRSAQLKAKGVPGGVIGNLARAAGAAPGGPNYHGSK